MNTEERYSQAIRLFAERLPEKVLLPGHSEFEAERHVWNGAFNRLPALIVRCTNTSDIVTAISFAREQHLAVSVRSGGHSTAGHSTNDGGIVIDLSRMKAISVDPEARTARIEPGLTLGEVAQALQPYGLALTSGDTGSVGVGGLVPGGGIGWMVRKYGLTIDRLRAVELVTASGEILRASADEHPELFWGLRGGGGNFGIATAFEVELHPGAQVLGGAVFYDIADAATILPAFTRYALAAPEELTCVAVFAAAPPAPFIPPDKQGKPVLILSLCYSGSPAEGVQIVRPLQEFATPIATMVAPMPYPAIFALGEEGAVRGRHYHVRSFFLQTVHDDVLGIMVKELLATLSPTMLVQIRILGGAMSRISPDATAFAHRDKQALCLITNFGPDPLDATMRTERVWQALRPYANGAYMSFLGDEGRARIQEAYPPATYARLVALKNQYDPTNMFHLNQNIPPAS